MYCHILELCLNCCVFFYSTAQLMCIYMKKWLNRTGQKSDFTTYSMNLMVIFYLQQQNYLPPIFKFFENVNASSALTVGRMYLFFFLFRINITPTNCFFIFSLAIIVHSFGFSGFAHKSGGCW